MTQHIDTTPMADAQARLLLERAARTAVHLDRDGRRWLDDVGLDTNAVDAAANLLVARGHADLVMSCGALTLMATDTGRASVTHLTVVREQGAA